MKHTIRNRISPEEQLGILAMRFCRTKDEAEKAAIAGDYEAVVARLIQSGKWRESPPFEDQLPDAWMPAAFYKHWSLPMPSDPNGQLNK